MEDAILTLAQAIESLAEAITRDKRVPASITIEKTTEYVKGVGWPVTKITEEHDADFSGNRGDLPPGEKATAFDPSRIQSPTPSKPEESIITMDDAGTPTKFKYRCGICGEEGRNRQSCQEEMVDGTHHWITEVI